MQPERIDECVIILGPLHIRMVFLAAIGKYVESSGWINNFERVQISMVGCIESFLRGSKVKKSRCIHEVLLAALVTKARTA